MWYYFMKNSKAINSESIILQKDYKIKFREWEKRMILEGKLKLISKEYKNKITKMLIKKEKSARALKKKFTKKPKKT